MDGKDLAPVLIMGIIFLPLMIKSLLNHQRQMTELTYRLNQQTATPPVVEHDQMRTDLQDLKQMVQEQAIAIDNLSSKLDRVATQSLQDRLTESAK